MELHKQSASSPSDKNKSSVLRTYSSKYVLLPAEYLRPTVVVVLLFETTCLIGIPEIDLVSVEWDIVPMST